jgi:hypothetical protein
MRLPIVCLLSQVDRLWCFVAELYLEAAPRGSDAQVAVAEPPYQVERLARRLFPRQAHGVVGYPFLDRFPDLRGGAEEAVGRH